MRQRPQDSTSALAALITGNHRCVARRGGGVVGPAAASDGSSGGRPFALVWQCESIDLSMGELFDQPQQDLYVVRVLRSEPLGRAGSAAPASAPEPMPSATVDIEAVGVREAVAAVEFGLGEFAVPIVVVLAEVGERFVRSEFAWKQSEARAFDAVRELLASSAKAAEAVCEGRLRVVGAIFDRAERRVHWLGEFPDQARYVGQPSRR
ncbi:MAG: hypothetical protein LW636_12695 [Planctomycetaceae bacterium]|nr:hypothetical protein [Planctomycetaceae bacterium]